MSVKITYLGHSGFLFESKKHSLVVDPFLSGNPLAKHTPDRIRCKYIALTHGHEDHFGDTMTIAANNDATVIAPFEVCEFIKDQGHEKVLDGNPGGRVRAAFGYIAFTQAFHSSSYEGQYMGAACGLVIHFEDLVFYHCGDTALFSDMKLIGELAKPDIAAIPVGDRYTMGPELGAKAAEFIRPRVAIPIHYATFPALTDDISAFKPNGVDVRVMEPGETWDWSP